MGISSERSRTSLYGLLRCVGSLRIKKEDGKLREEIPSKNGIRSITLYVPGTIEIKKTANVCSSR